MGDQFDGLYLANSATHVFFDVLTLAGSALAESPWEQNLVLYFADGGLLYGRGMCGFDLEQLPWTQGCATEKLFFLRTIDLALSGHGWKRLSYEPPYVAEDLSAYRGPAPVSQWRIGGPRLLVGQHPGGRCRGTRIQHAPRGRASSQGAQQPGR
jgi:hypothetical protein